MITKIKSNEAYKKTLLKPVFSDASDLEDLNSVLIKQDKAKNALELGLSINKDGYNIYLSGEPSSRKKMYLKSLLESYSSTKDVPNDICYINNFREENKYEPVLLEFKAGNGYNFKTSIESFAKQTKSDLKEMFNSVNYREELEALEQEYSDKSLKLLNEYSELAKAKNFLLYLDNGNIVAIMCDKYGKELSEKKISKFIVKHNDKYQELMQDVNILLSELAYKDSILIKEKEELLSQFDKTKASEIILKNLEPMMESFIDNALNENIKLKLKDFAKGIKKYILDNLELFVENIPQPNQPEMIVDEKTQFEEYFKFISVNLLVDNKDLKHAPVVFCENIEDEFDLFGGVMYEIDKKNYSTDTDHLKIKAGDILKANGGYLIINIRDLLLKDLWEDFEKCLINKEVKFIGRASQTLVLSDNLKPEPINIDLKVILVGSLDIYYALFEDDKLFRELFEIHAKFDYRMDRTEENELLYAMLLKKICLENSLNILSYDAICRVIEYSSKIVENKNKLALYYSDIYKILIEADNISKLKNRELIEVEDIELAIDDKINRVNSAKKYRNERVKNQEVILSVHDEKVGEINALCVLDYSEYRIGDVSKITANTYKSKKYSINSSDKEGLMSGNLHNKALNIVSGYLGEVFGKSREFPYSINLTFEQNYGGVDGDSATLAKTCAILSNLSNTPIKQRYGITGSMNQKGEVQIIGGVNEKVEGFFDLCKTKGLDSGGGVIIPRANLSDLMLSKEIINAIDEGIFNIYAVDNIKDAIEILTGETFDNICKKIEKTY